MISLISYINDYILMTFIGKLVKRRLTQFKMYLYTKQVLFFL